MLYVKRISISVRTIHNPFRTNTRIRYGILGGGGAVSKHKPTQVCKMFHILTNIFAEIYFSRT